MPSKKALKKQIKFLSERIENLIAEKTILIEKPQSVAAKDIRYSHHMEKIIEESLTLQIAEV